MQQQNKLTLLHLSLIDGIGPQAIAALLEKINGGPLAQLYNWMPSDYLNMSFNKATALKLFNGLRDKKTLETELTLIEKHNIQLLTLSDPEYPTLLRHIHAPPMVLYTQGTALHIQTPVRIAVVGSRAADAYGAACITAIVPELVTHSCQIISGGALGADTMAHQVALETGGQTIAVIGSGLLRPYPASNRKLFEKIIELNGAVISPFPLTMQALPGNFPARNRIIAGLSQATLVIQAAARSGASITANYALEQGREVGAIPGPIGNPLSEGCHRLIGQGALLVTCAQDILQAIGITSKETATAKQNLQPALRISKKAPLLIKTISQDPLISLCQEAQSYDTLLQTSNMTSDQLQSKLWELQIDGLLEQNFIGMWQATRVSL